MSNPAEEARARELLVDLERDGYDPQAKRVRELEAEIVRLREDHRQAVEAMAKARRATRDAECARDLEGFAAFEAKTAMTKLRKHGQRLRRALVAIVGDPPEAWENANGTDITKMLRTLLKVTAYLERA